MRIWPFGRTSKPKESADIGPNREAPPGKPERPKCIHCGGDLTRDDQYKGVCPHCKRSL